MMHGAYGMGWFGGIFMMLIPMALFGLIIYWAVRLAIRDSHKRGTSSDALEILKSRYARSEITAEEFKRLKEEIAQ